MTREELWLAAIAGLEGVNPPDYPVWHYEQMLAAIYDAVTGAADPRPFPERSWHLDEFLYAVYCAVAGLDDPGCPAPTCRIEEFWNGIYDAATGDDSASVPNPVWRIEEFLSCIFDVASGWGASVLTETGNAPLTLANAIARAIKSLTQTGLCTQADTPTPDAPADIVCNNGTVSVRHQSGLPVRYQLLSYLRANANVDVGVKTTKNTELEAAWTRITSAAQYLYQSDSNSSGSTNTTAYITSGGNWRFGNLTASISPSQDKRYVSIQNSNGVSLNGEQVASYGTVGSFTSTNTLRVLGSGASLRIEYLKVRQSGVLVRDLVPVRDTVDGTYGFYDLVGGTFYTNANATFTPGAEVDDPIEIVAVGTPEVLTVGDQTATVPDLYAVGDYKDEVDVISGTVTRRVGVKVLDGTEAWIEASVKGIFYCDMNFPSSAGYVAPAISSHFTATNQSNNSMPDCSCKLANTVKLGVALHIKYTPYAGNLDDWKFYLAAQYAAGTPVIIVYPLAEATTESVAGQPLHTVAGTNTVSVTAEVSPVALTCEYYGASS